MLWPSALRSPISANERYARSDVAAAVQVAAHLNRDGHAVRPVAGTAWRLLGAIAGTGRDAVLVAAGVSGSRHRDRRRPRGAGFGLESRGTEPQSRRQDCPRSPGQQTARPCPPVTGERRRSAVSRRLIGPARRRARARACPGRSQGQTRPGRHQASLNGRSPWGRDCAQREVSALAKVTAQLACSPATRIRRPRVTVSPTRRAWGRNEARFLATEGGARGSPGSHIGKPSVLRDEVGTEVRARATYTTSANVNLARSRHASATTLACGALSGKIINAS